MVQYSIRARAKPLGSVQSVEETGRRPMWRPRRAMSCLAESQRSLKARAKRRQKHREDRAVGSHHPSLQSSSTPPGTRATTLPHPSSLSQIAQSRRPGPAHPLLIRRGRRLARTRSDDPVPVAARSDSVPTRPTQAESGLSASGGERAEWATVVVWGRAHGGVTRRRRIGGEGRRLGRRPGGEVGLARHPAAALLRLHLHLLRSRGCFGCCEDAVKHVSELSKSLIAHAQHPTVGEEFWSTTTIEVDPADLRGPIHTSAWDLDQLGVGSSHNLADSANHGFSLWKQTRDEWTDNTRRQPLVKQIQEPVLSWNAAYESLLGSNKPFPQPIPLHEMVDFLVDIWEQEGLYD